MPDIQMLTGYISNNQMMFLLTGFDSLRENIINLIMTIQGTLEKGTIQSMLTTAIGVMKFGEADANAVSLIMSNISCPLGFVLMVVYAVAGILRKVNSGREVGFEDIVAPCLFILIADIALTNSGKIIGAFMGISNGAADALSNNILNQMDVQLAQSVSLDKTSMKESSVVELVVLTMCTYFGWLVAVIARLVLFVVCMTAKIELLVRFAFAPIGIASVADEGSRGEAVRFLKKLLASALVCAAVVGAVYMACTVGNNIYTANTMTQANGNAASTLNTALIKAEAMFMTVLVPFVAIGSVSVAKAAINEMVGS